MQTRAHQTRIPLQPPKGCMHKACSRDVPGPLSNCSTPYPHYRALLSETTINHCKPKYTHPMVSRVSFSFQNLINLPISPAFLTSWNSEQVSLHFHLARSEAVSVTCALILQITLLETLVIGDGWVPAITAASCTNVPPVWKYSLSAQVSMVIGIQSWCPPHESIPCSCHWEQRVSALTELGRKPITAECFLTQLTTPHHLQGERSVSHQTHAPSAGGTPGRAKEGRTLSIKQEMWWRNSLVRCPKEHLPL